LSVIHAYSAPESLNALGRPPPASGQSWRFTNPRAACY
jgi:hypothetical protein